MAKKDDNTEASAAETDVEVSTDVEVTTDASANPDLSTGKGVGDVKAEDIPNALEAPNLPPDVRAELVRNHPVTPGAQPAYVTQKEQPMPVVTGTRDGAEVNDLPIKRYFSPLHPELVVWHPNGERTIQFHNHYFATANVEWQAVVEGTPEVEGPVDEVPQGGGVQINADGHVVSLAGQDVDPVRLADVQGAGGR